MKAQGTITGVQLNQQTGIYTATLVGPLLDDAGKSVGVVQVVISSTSVPSIGAKLDVEFKLTKTLQVV